MAPRTIEIVSDIVDSPANTTESLKDLRSLANATKSLASGQRNLEKRADELALSCLMAMRSVLADVSLPEGQGGEVIFEAPALSSAVRPAAVAAQPAPRQRAASAPRKPLSAAAARVLTGTAAVAILCLGAAAAFFAYDRFAAANPADRSVALTPSEPMVIAAPLDGSAEPKAPAALAPVAAAQEPVVAVREPVAAAQKPVVTLDADADPEPSRAESAIARHGAHSVERPSRVEDVPASGDRTTRERFAATSVSETAESRVREDAAAPPQIADANAMPAPAESVRSEAPTPVAIAKTTAESTAVSAAPAAAAQSPAASSEPSAPKSINELLDEGAADLQLGGPRAADKKPSKTGLDRADLKTGMDKLRGRIHGCAARTGTNGIAKLKFSVEPDGHVSVASVVGKLAGTEFASCVEPVVKGARFPAFDGPPSTYSFPVMLTR